MPASGSSTATTIARALPLLPRNTASQQLLLADRRETSTDAVLDDAVHRASVSDDGHYTDLHSVYVRRHTSGTGWSIRILLHDKTCMCRLRSATRICENVSTYFRTCTRKN